MPHLGPDIPDPGEFLDRGVQVLEGIEEIIDHLDAAEHLGALRGELGFELVGGDLEGTDPAAEADQVNGADVAQGYELALDFALRGR